MTVSHEEPDEYVVQIPPAMKDDTIAAFAHWRNVARHDGWEVLGVPRIEVLEPANLGTDENPCYPFGQDALYVRVVGPAKKLPPRPLPTFEPSREAVEAAAKVVAKQFDPNITWDQSPAHVKNFYTRFAVRVLTEAGQHLVADAAAHVGNNPSAYEVINSDEFLAVAKRTRERVFGVR